MAVFQEMQKYARANGFALILDTPYARPVIIIQQLLSSTGNWESIMDADVATIAGMLAEQEPIARYFKSCELRMTCGTYFNPYWCNHSFCRVDTDTFVDTCMEFVHLTNLKPKRTRQWLCDDLRESIVRWEEKKQEQWEKHKALDLAAIETLQLRDAKCKPLEDMTSWEGYTLYFHTCIPALGLVSTVDVDGDSMLRLVEAMRRLVAALQLDDRASNKGCSINAYWTDPTDPEFKDNHVRGYINMNADDYYLFLQGSGDVRRWLDNFRSS